MSEENEKRETVADILAEIRAYGAQPPPRLLWLDIADRIEAAWKRERERDERLLFRLLWFDIEDYQSDWACKAYRQTIKDCCARLGIPYHESGKEIADEMDKSKLGVEVAREVYDE
jgi:hypothetical protein